MSSGKRNEDGGVPHLLKYLRTTE